MASKSVHGLDIIFDQGSLILQGGGSEYSPPLPGFMRWAIDVCNGVVEFPLVSEECDDAVLDNSLNLASWNSSGCL